MMVRFVQGEDVFAVGKSLCYTCLPGVFECKEWLDRSSAMSPINWLRGGSVSDQRALAAAAEAVKHITEEQEDFRTRGRERKSSERHS